MKKLGLAGIVAVGVAMFGMSTTAHAESYLHATGDEVLQWELFLDGLPPDEPYTLVIECDGEFVEYIQGEPQANADGEDWMQFGTAAENSRPGCLVRATDMEDNTITTVAFPQVPKAGANTTTMLVLVAVLVGAGGLLVGATRLRRGQVA